MIGRRIIITISWVSVYFMRGSFIELPVRRTFSHPSMTLYKSRGSLCRSLAYQAGGIYFLHYTYIGFVGQQRPFVSSKLSLLHCCDEEYTPICWGYSYLTSLVSSSGNLELLGHMPRCGCLYVSSAKFSKL